MEKKKLTSPEEFLRSNYIVPVYDNEEGSPTQGQFILTIGKFRISPLTFSDIESAFRWVIDHPVLVTMAVFEVCEDLKFTIPESEEESSNI